MEKEELAAHLRFLALEFAAATARGEMVICSVLTEETVSALFFGKPALLKIENVGLVALVPPEFADAITEREITE